MDVDGAHSTALDQTQGNSHGGLAAGGNQLHETPMEVEEAVMGENNYDDLDLSKPLISYAGKDVLKEAWERRMLKSPSLKNALDFISEFQEKHRLHYEEIDEAVNLLEVAGISQTLLATEILNNLTTLFKQRIPRLSQAQLSAILEDSFSFLTVSELASVPIATLERLKVVKPTVWSQIVQNGLSEAPYVDLPLSIRQRIWMQEPAALDHEIEKVIAKMEEAPPLMFNELCSNSGIESRKAKNPILLELLRLIQNLGDDLVDRAIQILYTRALDQAGSPQLLQYTNLFHDFVIHSQCRSKHSIIATLRRCARILSVSPNQATVSEADVRFVFETIHNRIDGRSYVLLLLCSSYSRDFLADQHLVRLYGHRGEVDISNESIRNDVVKHLTSDITLVQLTSLVLHSLKREQVIQGILVLQEEVNKAFEQFFPLLINEMALDANLKQDGYFCDIAKLPDTALKALIVQNKFERRVISTYCLHLFTNKDIVGLSRFRLLLDAVVAASDPKEEIREVVLADSLILAMYEVK